MFHICRVWVCNRKDISIYRMVRCSHSCLNHALAYLQRTRIISLNMCISIWFYYLVQDQMFLSKNLNSTKQRLDWYFFFLLTCSIFSKQNTNINFISPTRHSLGFIGSMEGFIVFTFTCKDVRQRIYIRPSSYHHLAMDSRSTKRACHCYWDHEIQYRASQLQNWNKFKHIKNIYHKRVYPQI